MVATVSKVWGDVTQDLSKITVSGMVAGRTPHRFTTDISEMIVSFRSRFFPLWLHRLLLALILFVSTGLRLFRLGYPSLWIDEIGQVLVAGLPFPQFWLGVEMHHGAAPLDYLVTKISLLLGARFDFALRLPAALWGILAVYWAYRLGEKFFSRETGLLSAMFLAINPMHLFYSQEVRFYALFIFLTLLSTELFWRAWKKDQMRWWLFYAITALLMLYSHYYGSFVIALHGAWALVDGFWPATPPPNTSWRSRFIHFLLAAGVASVLFLPWVIYDFPKEKGFGGATPPDLTISLIRNVLGEMTGLKHGASLSALLALSGFFFLFRTKKAVAVVLGVWLMSLLPITLWIDHRNIYFFDARQIIFGLPFFFILVAGGVDGWLALLGRAIQPFWSGARWHWVYSGLIASLIVGLLIVIFTPAINFATVQAYYQHMDGREDWKGAGALLMRNMASSERVVFLSSADRYYMKHYLPANIWEKTFEVTDEATLHGVVSDGSPVWVLVSPYTASVNPEMKDVKLTLMEMGGVPFVFNQRFNLYFVSLQKDGESLADRAKTWSAPERLHWWVVVGGAMRAANVHDAALQAYQHAAELPDFQPKQANAFVQAGVEALAVGDAALALDLLNQALSLDTSNKQARLHQARALLALNRADEALATLNEVQQQNGPNDYWLQWLKGNAYEALAQWDDAIGAYQKALSLKPDASHLYFFIARAFQKMGDAAQARKWYQAYLDHAPEGDFALQAQEFLQTKTSP